MSKWQFERENPYCVKEAYKMAKAGDLEGACSLIGRPNKGWIIHDAIEEFGIDNFTQLRLNRAIEYAYCMDDFPFYQRHDLWYYLLEDVYERPKNFIKRKIPNTIRVYRGGTPNGWSWTTDIDKAIWFSRRWNMIDKLEQGLWTTEITADDILFFGDANYESEIILKSNDGRRDIEQVILEEAQE